VEARDLYEQQKKEKVMLDKLKPKDWESIDGVPEQFKQFKKGKKSIITCVPEARTHEFEGVGALDLYQADCYNNNELKKIGRDITKIAKLSHVDRNEQNQDRMIHNNLVSTQKDFPLIAQGPGNVSGNNIQGPQMQHTNQRVLKFARDMDVSRERAMAASEA